MLSWPLVFLLSIPAQGHGGRLDSHGCHEDAALGAYHCHEGAFAGRAFPAKKDMLLELPAKPAGRLEQKVKAGERGFEGKVVSVQDGDTLEVLRHGRAVRVRLHGVDCPEKRQAFGAAAKNRTSELAFGQTVRVFPRDQDRYGRLVAEILLPDGRSLNQELVKAGLAWWYKRYAPDDMALADLEHKAKAVRLGLWGELEPLAPWSFRRKDPIAAK